MYRKVCRDLSVCFKVVQLTDNMWVSLLSWKGLGSAVWHEVLLTSFGSEMGNTPMCC